MNVQVDRVKGRTNASMRRLGVAFSAEHADAGLEVTEAIWLDMRVFAGYLEHERIRDVTDAVHLIVVSHWATIRG